MCSVQYSLITQSRQSCCFLPPSAGFSTCPSVEPASFVNVTFSAAAAAAPGGAARRPSELHDLFHAAAAAENDSRPECIDGGTGDDVITFAAATPRSLLPPIRVVD